MPDYTSETIAVYYSFRASHILIAGLDDRSRLIIHTSLTQTETPVSAIAAQILKFNLPTWINTHEPLKTAIAPLVRGELNFDTENEIERQNLDDLYYSLRQENRIAIAPGVSLQAATAQHCLKILLKGMMPELCREKSEFAIEFDDPTEFHMAMSDFEQWF